MQTYALTDPEGAFHASLAGPTPITLPAGDNVPPSAAQPGTSEVLETSDMRFSSDTTQYGNTLWAATSVDFGGAVVRWYEFDTAAHSVALTGDYYTSLTSSEFNAAIAARPDGSADLIMSSVDATNNFNPRILVARKGKASHHFDAAVVAFASPAVLTGNFDPNFGTQRWGDFAGAALDPLSASNVWGFNETVPDTDFWGTELVQFR